ncbi:uncharacterized protein CDAR_211301 [Caerostris darwini]|uniref:Uncharacterized protein n=1 Tax=Caerostris darwini TaxID=1538125 RepID=A0AAV4VY30_9ARAC|nr:uncharacterized protein CDAR_211301 [Caerostris darwini]
MKVCLPTAKRLFDLQERKEANSTLGLPLHVPSGIENDIGPRKTSKNNPKNDYRTAFWGTIPDAADNESLRSNCQTIIRPSGLKTSKFNTWFASLQLFFGFVLVEKIFCGYQMASHEMSFAKVTKEGLDY